MKSSDLPTKIAVPFAQNAGLSYRRDVPLQSSDAGAASFMLGFPPLTFQPTGAGGSPVDGRDMNGILYALSSIARSWCAGVTLTFDQSFAQAVGGYPLGAVLRSATDPTILLISQRDANQTDPADDAEEALWKPIGAGTLTSVAQSLAGKVSRTGDTMTGSLFMTGTYSLNGGLATVPLGAQMDQTQIYLQLAKGTDNTISGTLTFRDSSGGYHDVLTVTPRGNILSVRGNPFLEVGSNSDQPMRIEAFTAIADSGQRVTFPKGFSGTPVSIIVNALEADWSCAAAAGTWAADGFTMTSYATNTAGRPQKISVMAVGPV